MTGRWTSGGILRDVRSAEGSTSPQGCQFLAQLGGGPGAGAFGAPRTDTGPSNEAPTGFTKVFENAFGSLWRNDKLVASPSLAPPAVSLLELGVLAGLGALLLLLDLVWPATLVRWRVIAGAGGLVLALVCVSNLIHVAAGELRHPAVAPPGETDGPVGGPPPGAAPWAKPGREPNSETNALSSPRPPALRHPTAPLNPPTKGAAKA